MQFEKFATYLERLEQLSSRLEMTSELAKLYGDLETDEVRVASYLLQGQLQPAYDSLEFQMSIKMVIRALAGLWGDLAITNAGSQDLEPHAHGQAGLFIDKTLEKSSTDQSDDSSAIARVTQLFKQVGDLGKVAEQLVREALAQQSGSKHESKPTSILELYQALQKIALERGEGSQERKLQGLQTLLHQLYDPSACKFVVRIVLGKLRLGFSTQTLFDALSWKTWGDKRDHDILELAYQKQADVGNLAAVYLKAGSEALQQYNVVSGIPLVPALCQRLNSAEEIITKMNQVFVEPKYDGVRVQLHFNRDTPWKIKTFTRSLEESSHQFPELVKIREQLKCRSCILDAEAIGYDPQTGSLKAFQETITRKRKHAVDEVASQIPLRFYVFDVLELDGTTLIDRPLRKRKDLLKDLFEDSEVILKTPYIETNKPEEVRNYHVEQLALGLEGAVIKQVNSVYQSGRQGWSWVKIKEVEGVRGKLADTLDCVVMGYYFGKGKRSAFGIGAFLVGVLDHDRWLTVAKIGTGLSDDQFKELRERCEALKTSEMPNTFEVAKELYPDVWARPELVVEIAADEITTSPLHSAGLALRFPRLVRMRTDKSAEQATTIREVKEIMHVSTGKA